MTPRAGASPALLAGAGVLFLYALALAAWSLVGLARALDTLRDPAMGLPGLVALLIYVPIVTYAGTLLALAARILIGRSGARGLITAGVMAGAFAVVIWVLFVYDRTDPVIWVSGVVGGLSIVLGVLARSSK